MGQQTLTNLADSAARWILAAGLASSAVTLVVLAYAPARRWWICRRWRARLDADLACHPSNGTSSIERSPR